MRKRKLTKNDYRTLVGYAERDAVLWKMGFETYSDYLASDFWKGIRQGILVSSNSRCGLCKKTANQVHHLWYSAENLQGSSKEGLVSICRHCHHSIEFSAGLGKHEPKEAAFLFKELSKVGNPKDLPKVLKQLQDAISEKEHFSKILADLHILARDLKVKKNQKNLSEFDRKYQKGWKLLRLAGKLRRKYGSLWGQHSSKSRKIEERKVRNKLYEIEKIRSKLKIEV